MSFEIKSASQHDLSAVSQFLQPFMTAQHLLQRTSADIQLLLRHGFKAESDGSIIGFCALEIYSMKLAEIQCLAVAESHQRKGIGRQLVNACVRRAKEENVLELLAISSSEPMFKACGLITHSRIKNVLSFIKPKTTPIRTATRHATPTTTKPRKVSKAADERR